MFVKGQDPCANQLSRSKTHERSCRLAPRVLSASARRNRSGQADPVGRAYPIERRNLTSRQALLHRIAMEYDEMPGLRLTAAQAQRLFGLRDDICMRVFDAFVEAAILRRDANNRYVRNRWL